MGALDVLAEPSVYAMRRLWIYSWRQMGQGMTQDLAGRYELRYEPSQAHVLVLVNGQWQVVRLSPSEVETMARILGEATTR